MKSLHQRALEIMQANKVDTVFATEDGNIFLPKDKQAAKNHARLTKSKLTELDKKEVQKAINSSKDDNPKK